MSLKPACNHDPLRARPGQPFDSQQDCPICWNALHKPEYNRLAGGDGTVHPLLTPVPAEPSQPPTSPFGNWAWGDLLSAALEKLGITKERVSAWLGRPCNCKERQAKLNALGGWLRGWLLGRSTREDLDKILGD